MKDTKYGVAMWAKSWDEVFKSNSPQGTANLVDNRIALEIPFGRMLGNEGMERVGQEQEPTQVDWLYGFSQDGYYLALKNAYSNGTSSHIPGGDHQHIGARYLFAGRNKFNPEATVTKAIVSYTGLEEWVAKTPFRALYAVETGKLVSIEYDLEHEDSYNSVLLDDGEHLIEVHHTYTYRHGAIDVKGVEVSHGCNIEIDFKHGCAFDDAVSAITSISRFLTICLGFGAEIKEIALKFGEEGPYTKCHSSFFRYSEPSKSDSLWIPFSLPVIEDGIQDYLGAWMRAEDDLLEASNVFASLITNNWEMPLDLKFLAASQALEALSRVGTNLLSMPQQQYDEYKETILEAVKGTDAGKWLAGCFPGNRKGQGRLLRELLERHQVLFEWFVGDKKGFLNNQAGARNHYAHRKPTSKGHAPLRGEELYWHTECVLFLAHGIIWSNLGMDEQFFVDSLRKSCYRNYRVLKVRSFYSAGA